MAELIATTPNLASVETPGARLSLEPLVPIWSIAPYRGQAGALSAALEQAHGLPFAAPGVLQEKDGARIAWSGLDQAFLLGAAPDAALATHAALSDQSDAWSRLMLEGPAARDVLARFVPIDLSPGVCPPGSARRTLLGHMPVLILHSGGDRFELLVFRSMTGTAMHELTHAMQAVAARAGL